jgi:hypothetical protein
MWMFFSYGTGIQPKKKSVFGIHTPSIIQYGVLMSAGWFTLAPHPPLPLPSHVTKVHLIDGWMDE